MKIPVMPAGVFLPCRACGSGYLAILAFLLPFAMMFMACGAASHNPVDTAEHEYEVGRYASAQAVCDRLAEDGALDCMTTDELCRLSLLAARLSDNNEEGDVTLAVRCMQTALAKAPDSVSVFLHSLPADDQSRILVIRQIVRTLDADSADADEITMDFNPADSAAVNLQ